MHEIVRATTDSISEYDRMKLETPNPLKAIWYAYRSRENGRMLEQAETKLEDHLAEDKNHYEFYHELIVEAERCLGISPFTRMDQTLQKLVSEAREEEIRRSDD
jgi:hypothetical protein